jgi:hypothetical protein
MNKNLKYLKLEEKIEFFKKHFNVFLLKPPCRTSKLQGKPPALQKKRSALQNM